MADLVILYSGGSDSYLLLKLALQFKRVPHCVLINMGQKNIKELEYARKQLLENGVCFDEIEIKGLNISSGLVGDMISGKYDGVNPMNVPGRNTLFISLAYSIAESMGISEIWFGANYQDRLNLFPDCYQEYVVAMNNVLSVAPSKPIKLYAPLLGWTQEMVYKYLNNVFNVKPSEFYSGY